MSETPRIVVGALITNENGEVLLTTARKWEGQWVVQGGHLETGETLEEALKREVKEETNLDIKDLELVCVQDAISPEDYYKKKHMVFIDYSCRVINPDQLRLNHELQEHRWVRPEDSLRMDLSSSTRRFIEEFLKSHRE